MDISMKISSKILHAVKSLAKKDGRTTKSQVERLILAGMVKWNKN